MPPRKKRRGGAEEPAADPSAAADPKDRLLVAMAKAQIIALGEMPAGNDDVATMAEELEELISAREQGAAAQEDDDEGGEEEEEEEVEEEGAGDDGGDGNVGAKVDELKQMLERDQSNHDDFVNIKPSGKCGVCLANGLSAQKARNGSYGCFSCNMRVCWHPDCLRDHLAMMRGNKAKGAMVRKERAPAAGGSKNHFGEEEEEEEEEDR